jgi:hypothetical protein
MLFLGVFPDRLKYAIIKPLYKNDDRCDISKYRPVSLLTPCRWAGLLIKYPLVTGGFKRLNIQPHNIFLFMFNTSDYAPEPQTAETACR